MLWKFVSILILIQIGFWGSDLFGQSWYLESAYNRTFIDHYRNSRNDFYRVGYMVNFHVGLNLKLKKDQISRLKMYTGLFYSDVHYESSFTGATSGASSDWNANPRRYGFSLGTSVLAFKSPTKRLNLGTGFLLQMPFVLKGNATESHDGYSSVGGVFQFYSIQNTRRLDTANIVAKAQLFLPLNLQYRLFHSNKCNAFVLYQYLFSVTADIYGGHTFCTPYNSIGLRLEMK